ncbi:MAG: hypothetical protein IPN67_04745 [Bacteroidales bacterium]|nr:hypothetical protein [Bacteroidales bacterium]
MRSIKFLLAPVIMLSLIGACQRTNQDKSVLRPGSQGYIEVSHENPGYFQFSDGSPYIPIGINMINPSGKYHNKPDSAMIEIERWMKNLSANGGNYVRVWLSESFWDMEDKQAGQYRDEKIRRIDRFIEMARENHLRIKITLEHFRSVTLEENNQSWATKFVYHTSKGGPLDSIRQYLTTPAGYKLFLDKADFYQKHYGSDTLFFGWELWNEMNAMHGPQDSIFFQWNTRMLREIKQRFPKNLVMQSLGSFDNEDVRPVYKKMMLLPGNEVAQVHRYLDLGADMELCHAPMDVICSSAVEEILSYNTGKPVMLAETGAVEPSHSGPSKYYRVDTAGILLHDILFTPFFSGSAGCGMCWHWESYVDRNNLWYHFGRFSESVKGIDPITEKFIPSRSENGNLRIYQLNGKNYTLLWLRDKRNTWQSELRDGQQPLSNDGVRIALPSPGSGESFKQIDIYDPWQNKWQNVNSDGTELLLPDFKRSLVIRIERKICVNNN